MSSEKKAEKKTSKLGALGSRIARFFKDIRAELKKVTWMNKSQLASTTVVVLLACLLFGAVIWLVDFGMAELYKVIFG